ncbi:MAG: hypothetical protein QG602_4206 [Verrucomicrobiota bacterium]|nr:hypothetical protein [Verrucomicrobiota bacterium]
MKTFLIHSAQIMVLCALLAAPLVHAQRQGPASKGPMSKLYLAETKGPTEIMNGDKIYRARQATAFDAPGTVIVTKEEAHNALVYSNGTGLFVDQTTRVEISRFQQEPFKPDYLQQFASRYEPSVSQSNVNLPYGAIGICTSQLISGSSMLYSTPHATVNIRGGKVVIESTPEGTIVDLLEGDLTVRSGDKDVGGQILRPGERAFIPTATDGQPVVITVQPIPREAMPVDDRRVEMACNARQSVTFDIIARRAEQGLDRPDDEPAGGDSGDEAAGAQADNQEIVANPTVPGNPPNQIVVSPDRLPGT